MQLWNLLIDLFNIYRDMKSNCTIVRHNLKYCPIEMLNMLCMIKYAVDINAVYQKTLYNNILM